MTCEERQLLQNRYIQSMEVYIDSLNFLRTKIGVIDRQEYEPLRRIAQHFQKQSNTARVALETHTAEHGCWTMPHSPAPPRHK